MNIFQTMFGDKYYSEATAKQRRSTERLHKALERLDKRCDNCKCEECKCDKRVKPQGSN